jgi:hypothetical protein
LKIRHTPNHLHAELPGSPIAAALSGKKLRQTNIAVAYNSPPRFVKYK